MEQYKVGDRVEVHPAMDAWMMGDRYGEIVKIGRKYVHIKMDKSGKIYKVTPHNIAGKV